MMTATQYISWHCHCVFLSSQLGQVIVTIKSRSARFFLTVQYYNRGPAAVQGVVLHITVGVCEDMIEIRTR